MKPPLSSEAEEEAPEKGREDSNCSAWKQVKGEDGRNYSYADTASLTCSDSLNSSLTDTDEETFTISPDNSLKARQVSRLSPVMRSGELPRALNAIQDVSFDSEYSSKEGKVHEPSKGKQYQTRLRRLGWALLLLNVGLLCQCFFRPSHRKRHEWKHFLEYEAPRVLQFIETSLVPVSFTIRLSGSRSDLLERSIDVLTRCTSVEAVQVEWRSSMRPPRHLFRHASHKVTHVQPIDTNAVLLLDEDVIFTCDELTRGFHLWQLNPDRMVGFLPFRHSTPQNIPPPLNWANSATASPISPGSGQYQLVSSRAAFVHVKYLRSFDSLQDKACPPFALSVHCTAISGKAPLAVAANPQEQRTSDIVPILGFHQERTSDDKLSTCLAEWMEGHDIQELPSEESTYLGA